MLVLIDNIKYRSNSITQRELHHYLNSLSSNNTYMSDVLIILLNNEKNITLEGQTGFIIKSDTILRIISHYFNNHNAAVKYMALLKVNNELVNNDELKNHLSLIHFITNNHPELLFHFDNPITRQLLNELSSNYTVTAPLGNPLIKPMSRNTYLLRKELEKKAPSLEKCVLLVQHGADSAVFNRNGDNLLHVVIKRRQLPEIDPSEVRLNPKQKDIDGRTALTHLMDLKDVRWDEIKKLLQLGVDPNAPFGHNEESSHYLIHYIVHHLSIRDLDSFLKFSPNLDIVDVRGQTVLDRLLQTLPHQKCGIQRTIIVDLCRRLLDNGATAPSDFKPEILDASIQASKAQPKHFSGENPCKAALFSSSSRVAPDLTDFTPPRGKRAGERRVPKPKGHVKKV